MAVKIKARTVLTNKIVSLTDSEVQAINEEFGHWDDIEHVSWVSKKLEEKSDSYTDLYMDHFSFLLTKKQD